MVQEQSHVRVYNFRVFSGHVESPTVVSYKATLPAIARMEGEALPGSEQEVPVSDLDPQGCYRRVNTGWGALD
jgi:hypothetical protein